MFYFESCLKKIVLLIHSFYFQVQNAIYLRFNEVFFTGSMDFDYKAS